MTPADRGRLSLPKGDELAPAIRRKLILEISGLEPKAWLLPAAGSEPVDCFVGEKIRRERIDRIFPGLLE